MAPTPGQSDVVDPLQALLKFFFPQGSGTSFTPSGYQQPQQSTSGNYQPNLGTNRPQMPPDYWTQKWDEWIEEMSRPLDMNDPVVKQTMVDVQNMVARSAQERGIQGGLANAASESALQKTFLGMNEARRNAMGNVLQARTGWEAQMNKRDDRESGKATDLGQLVGSVAGGALGALPALAGPAGMAFLPYTIPAGMNIGAGIGGQVGGMTMPSWSTFSVPKPVQPRGINYNVGGA